MSIFQRQGEIANIDGLLLPKYGVLKMSEVLAYDAMVRELPEFRKGLTDKQLDIEVVVRSVSILLKRLDPEWTLEKTRADEWELPVDGKIGGEVRTFAPDSLLIEELYTFFRNERDRWPTSDAPMVEAEQPGKKSTGKPSTGDSAKASPATKRSKA